MDVTSKKGKLCKYLPPGVRYRMYEIYTHHIIFTIFSGDKAIFKCLVKGIPEPEVQWSKGKWTKLKTGDRFNIYKDESTGEDVMEILNIAKKDAGTYNVTATNEHGTQQVAATLIVTAIPEEAEDWKAALKHRFV